MMRLIEDANKYGDFLYNYYAKIHDRTVISFDRLLVIYSAAHYIIDKGVCGDFAECGVYRGGSAKLILEVLANYCPANMLYLFDTFEGMPDCIPGVDLHTKGQFNETNYADVSDYLNEYHNVELNKGFFPQSVKRHHEKSKYCFVHIDMDIYQSYKDALEFFYPRMNKGGILLFDDTGFDSCPGAKKAVNEFFKDKQENVQELRTNQSLVVMSE